MMNLSVLISLRRVWCEILLKLPVFVLIALTACKEAEFKVTDDRADIVVTVIDSLGVPIAKTAVRLTPHLLNAFGSETVCCDQVDTTESHGLVVFKNLHKEYSAPGAFPADYYYYICSEEYRHSEDGPVCVGSKILGNPTRVTLQIPKGARRY